MSRGQTATKSRAAAPSKGSAKGAASAKRPAVKGQEQGMKVTATSVKVTTTKANIKAVAKEDEKKKVVAPAAEKEAAGGRSGQPAAAARPVRCRGQEDDQAGQEARLRHPRPAQRRAALRGGVLRPDRGRLRDAQRDGHQRRRFRRGRAGRGEQAGRGAPTTTTTATASWSRSPNKVPAKAEKSEPSERTDDPVRMYLREMGSVELLSREGEIAIAKRIEAGREAMIAGLCESPLTFQAIIIWRDELNDGKVFLRDIIDLEATYAGPDAKNNMAARARPAPRTATALPPPNGGEPVHRGAVAAASRRRAPLAASPLRPKARRRGRRGRRDAGRPTATSTTTTWRTRSRSPRSRPSSSRRCWRPSTTSPPNTSGCAACRTRTSRSA